MASQTTAWQIKPAAMASSTPIMAMSPYRNVPPGRSIPAYRPRLNIERISRISASSNTVPPRGCRIPKSRRDGHLANSGPRRVHRVHSRFPHDAAIAKQRRDLIHRLRRFSQIEYLICGNLRNLWIIPLHLRALRASAVNCLFFAPLFVHPHFTVCATNSYNALVAGSSGSPKSSLSFSW
jgi:hypothetical protein